MASRGTLVGAGILLAAYIAWGVAVHQQVVTPALEIAILVMPAVAGFVSVWVSPRGRLAPSVLLAVPAACFAGLLNYSLQQLGANVGYFTGVTGSLRVVGFTLLTAGLFSAIGGLLGVVARQVRGTA